jgi:A/G-specific adenine glycosylase
MEGLKKQFSKLLLSWNKAQNTRQMPWKGEKDPYLIWLSEIILQQTRVEQGLPYFLSFKEKYSTVKRLAEAPEDEVMRLWQGLGYYSRARNLHETAKHVHFNLNGIFPGNFDGLKQLKGVGDYTAAAIASFAFAEPVAVVDGNVIRLLSRVFGISEAFDTAPGKKKFAALACELIDKQQPGAYNQAIMDFGAVVCLPQNPLCAACPFNKDCFAFKNEQISVLPVRQNRVKIGERFFTYLVIKNKHQIVIQKRTGNDIWKNLYQFPMLETPKLLKKNFHEAISGKLGHNKFEIKSYSNSFTQQLTHLKIHAQFVEIEAKSFPSLVTEGAEIVKLADLHRFAFPKTMHLYLSQNSLL